MRASLELTIGDHVSLKASARATPAGLIAAGMLISAAVGAAIWISGLGTRGAER